MAQMMAIEWLSLTIYSEGRSVMRLKLLAVVAVGVFLLLAGPEVQGADKPKEMPYYAKVEIQGIFNTAERRDELQFIVIPTRPNWTKYRVDLSKLKEWTTEKLRKTNGRIVRVTGTLESQPVPVRRGVTENRLVIVVASMIAVDEAIPHQQEGT